MEALIQSSTKSKRKYDEAVKLKELIGDFKPENSRPYIFLDHNYGLIKHKTLLNITMSMIELLKLNVKVNRLAKRYPAALLKFLDVNWDIFLPHFQSAEFYDDENNLIPRTS